MSSVYVRQQLPYRQIESFSVLYLGPRRVFLNQTGTAILNLVDGKRTSQDVADAMLQLYGNSAIPPERMAKDVESFLQSLHRNGILLQNGDSGTETNPVSSVAANPSAENATQKAGEEGGIHSLQEACMTPKLERKATTLEHFVDDLYWQRRYIEKMHVELTYRCNFRCVHCYNTTHVGGKSELTTAEWIRALEQLAGMGCYDLTFTGGEIFVRKDVLEILDAACANTFAFRLNTNGSLIDEKILPRLDGMRPYLQSVDISFYGEAPATHDTLARRPGSYNMTVRAVKLLKEAGFNLVAKYVTMRDNFDGIAKFEHDMRSLGVPTCIHTGSLIPQTDRNRAPLVQLLTDEQYTALLRSRGGAKGTGDQGSCRPGIIRGAITPEGFVSPCEWLTDFKLGNLRENTLAEIWFGANFQSFRNVINQDAECKPCNLKSGCSRCPAHSYLETGSLLQCAPIQRHNAELTLALRN
jgi:radical SAM protein with 4Fe4S-binding SPASM domain